MKIDNSKTESDVELIIKFFYEKATEMKTRAVTIAGLMQHQIKMSTRN